MKIQVEMRKDPDYIDILCVEEGSVDLEQLKSAGVPGENIVTYRKGAKPPYLLRVRQREDKGSGN